MDKYNSFHFFLVCIMVLPLLLVVLPLCHDVELVQVKVSEGILEGELVNISTDLGQYYSFKGIPYAEPPVGSLRFKDPLPIKPWKDVRQAKKHGYVCIHYDIFEEKFPTANSSEDCLFLNVYTPAMRPKKHLPVVFFIHGGGYMSGSGNDTEYGADFLVKHEVVVVTLNYRLGAFGFLTLNTKEVPGNAGLKDQALALKWVNHNIKHFGGDPNMVTLMGQSAGSASIVHHMMSPMSRGLFKRGILMSGLPFCDCATPFEQERRAYAQGLELGLDTNDAIELLNFLQSVPATQLLNTRPPVLTQETIWNKGIRMFSYTPTAELDFGQQRFITKSPIESLKSGNIEDLDILIGYTSLEGLFEVTQMENGGLEEVNKFKELLVPRNILLEIPPSKVMSFSDRVLHQYFDNEPVSNATMVNFLNFESDHVFVYHVHRFLKYLPEGNSRKYLYKFFTVSDRNKYSFLGFKYNISATSHVDDLRYLFDAKRDPAPIDINSREYKLVEQTVTLFTNFVKYGNPTPDYSMDVVWPEYTKKERAYMMINDTLIPGTQLDADVVDFWTEMYADAGLPLP